MAANRGAESRAAPRWCGYGRRYQLRHKTITSVRAAGFTQWLPKTENGIATKHPDDAKGMEVAQQCATVGPDGERTKKFHGEGGDDLEVRQLRVE
jgi:hypothetical protein